MQIAAQNSNALRENCFVQGRTGRLGLTKKAVLRFLYLFDRKTKSYERKSQNSN